MENKFSEGEIVSAKENPSLKLIVRRCIRRIYFCKIQGDLTHKELAYFERELLAHTALAE